ncbi:hypothetical protein [Nocardioides humi]|uniref:Uncharacterized protein n=1 Tax=Nocardioides humi TaxID=449461 RepID=A0ABN2BN73_9ACTN|nr:hypothetical protein [Nocardioides humi]
MSNRRKLPRPKVSHDARSTAARIVQAGARGDAAAAGRLLNAYAATADGPDLARLLEQMVAATCLFASHAPEAIRAQAIAELDSLGKGTP